MSLDLKRREHILRVITEEYPDGVTPAELRARMQRSGRAYTLSVVQYTVATLRRQRLVKWDDETRTLRAAKPEDCPTFSDLERATVRLDHWESTRQVAGSHDGCPHGNTAAERAACRRSR